MASVPLVVLVAAAFWQAGWLGAGDRDGADAAAGEAPVPVSSLPPEGFLRLHVGDELRYRVEAGGATQEMRITILPPRPVAGADQKRVEGVPVLARMDFDGQVEEADQVWVVDAARGGLAVSAERCVVDASIPCNDPSRSEISVSWQQCPFGTLFSPVDAIPRRAFAAGHIAVTDPVKGTVWTYEVRHEGGSLYRLVLQGASAARATCDLSPMILVDIERGRIEEMGNNAGIVMRLVGVEQGEGPAIVLGGGHPEPKALVPPESIRGPFPAGAGGKGPEEWTLGDAWARLAAHDAAFADFLKRHPDAFLYDAFNATTRAEVLPGVAGGVHQTSYEWRIKVLALDRTMIEAVATKEVSQGVPTYTTRAAPAAVPDKVPPRFHPPARKMADIEAFVAAARASGFTPAPTREAPAISVLFDGEDADYYYMLVTGTKDVSRDGTASVSQHYVLLNADTGRLTDAVLPMETARGMLGAGP